MKSVIPKSKAKTAYGLLSDIAALAIDEPRRIRMAIFLNTDVANSQMYLDADEIPACNTVGCICGWAVALRGTKAQIDQQNQAHISDGGYGSMPGTHILGLDTSQAKELFNPDRGIKGTQGTLTHARSVVARIQRFQKRYRTQLLAKKV